MKTLAIVVVLMSCFIGMAWSHCHDDDEDENSDKCEDLLTHLVSNEYWELPNNNTVPYYVNNTYRPMHGQRKLPPLGGDVNRAAASWHQITFRDDDGVWGKCKFGLEYKGSTTLLAQSDPNDGKNVVSYGYLQWDSNRKIYAAVFTDNYRSPDPNRIKEQDMRFNYRANYYDHSSKGPGRICIKEIASHEWGHFVKLKDITSTKLTNPPCPRYAKYTMYNVTVSSD